MLWPLSVVLVANTNGRLAIPALAGLLVYCGRHSFMILCCLIWNEWKVLNLHHLMLKLSAFWCCLWAPNLSKWINMSSKLFHRWVVTSFYAFPYQMSWQYSDGKSLTGVSNADGVGRNRDSEPIFGSIACCERQVQYTQPWQTIVSWWH